MKLRDRVCARCGLNFEPNGMVQKYCAKCGAVVREDQRKARYERKKTELYEQQRRKQP